MKCLNAGGKGLLEKEDKNGNKWREKKKSLQSGPERG